MGRRREREVLEEAWSAATRSARHLIFVGGEPGVGKSRLVAEVATALYQRDATVLSGECVAELGLPYQPFVEPIEAVLSGLADGRLSTGRDRRTAAELDVGRMAVLEGLAVLAGRRQPGTRLGPDLEGRRRLYRAAVQGFDAIAAERPLVLVLEDLHWAGDDALQLFRYLVKHSAGSPMLILATHRTTPPDRSMALVHTAAELYRLNGVLRVDLGPLDIEDITELLVGESGASVSVARQAAYLLRDQTGGNPFYLRELWRDLAGDGGLAALRRDHLRTPESVRDTIQSRLDLLESEYRDVLELAAVLGEEVDVVMLLAAHSASSSAVSIREGVLAALDACVAHRLLEPTGGGRFRFLHALARQAVLDNMPPSQLAHVHTVAAEAVERVSAADRRVQRLAHHYANTGVREHAPRAVQYLVEAARLADRALAHREAAQLFEQAVPLADGSTQRDDLRLAAARSHHLAANFARARELDEQVATTGSPTHRLRAAIGYEATSRRTGRLGQPAIDLLTGALAGVERDPSDPLYVRAISSLGRAFAFTASTRETEVLSARAIEFARTIGRHDLLAQTLEASLVGLRPGHAAVQLTRATELSVLAKGSGDLHKLSSAAYHRGTLCYLFGDRQGLEDAYADLIRANHLTGQQYWEYVTICFDYARYFMSGDFGAAERTNKGLLEFGELIGTADSAEGPYGVRAYMIRREAGRLDQIRPLITGSEQPTNHWAPGLLALYTELGLTQPTRRLLDWLLDDQLPRYSQSGDWPATLAFLTEAALSLGDQATARRLRPMLAEYAGLNLLTGPFVALFGSADRYLGVVDSLLGCGTPEEWFASALRMDTHMRAPVHQAQTLAAHVNHLRQLGSAPRMVEEMEQQVRAIAEPLGLRRVLRMIGVPHPTDPHSEPRPDRLTRRELEVLRLLSEGMSNREIAHALVISENTAANHVRNILHKTRCDNRTQAARYATKRQLFK